MKHPRALCLTALLVSTLVVNGCGTDAPEVDTLEVSPARSGAGRPRAFLRALDESPARTEVSSELSDHRLLRIGDVGQPTIRYA